MKNQQPVRPAVTQTMLAGSADVQSAQARAALTGSPAPVEAPTSWIAVSADRITYVRPEIWLQGYEVHAGKQERMLAPARAYVAHGVVVIEEMDLSFPLSAVKNIRKSVTKKEGASS